MLPRHLSEVPPAESQMTQDLGSSTPTLFAFATLCARVLAEPQPASVSARDLPPEARAILVAAADSGSLCIEGNKSAFEADQRLLAVCIDQEDGERVEFRIAGDPEQTIRFLEGFRRLCQLGLVMHQVQNEFSLTAAGFDLAREIPRESVERLLAKVGRSP